MKNFWINSYPFWGPPSLRHPIVATATMGALPHTRQAKEKAPVIASEAKQSR